MPTEANSVEDPLSVNCWMQTLLHIHIIKTKLTFQSTVVPRDQCKTKLTNGGRQFKTEVFCQMIRLLVCKKTHDFIPLIPNELVRIFLRLRTALNNETYCSLFMLYCSILHLSGQHVFEPPQKVLPLTSFMNRFTIW